MKERPILFKADMVRAILEGHKTQTRRIVKPQPPNEDFTVADYCDWEDDYCSSGIPTVKFSKPFDQDKRWDWWPIGYKKIRCPYGRFRDRLWVKETSIISPPNWCDRNGSTHLDAPGGPRVVQYLATHSCTEAADDYKLKKTPSIFMPRWASRITLEITGIRVERLNDIIEQDAEAEGIQFIRDYPDADETLTAKQLYSFLWDSINGEGSWDLNPWVWVIEFRRVEK